MTRYLTAGLTALVLATQPFPLSTAAEAGPASVQGAQARDLVLERDLLGPSVGTGYFTNILGQRRDFRVDFNGRMQGPVLLLSEALTFKDGAREHYTWRFTPTGPGTYSGVREGVVGTAVIRKDGNRVLLDYSADVKGPDGKTTRLRFEDVLVKRADGSVQNLATAYLFGVQVGWVNIAIARGR